MQRVQEEWYTFIHHKIQCFLSSRARLSASSVLLHENTQLRPSLTRKPATLFSILFGIAKAFDH